MSNVYCPYCGASVELRDYNYIYHTNKYKGKVWVCNNYPKCDAYVGCHKNTEIPLGRLANKKLRDLKQEAHRQFDPIWKSGLMTRKDAYKWLASMLHISVEECHIGMFDVERCREVIKICQRQTNSTIVDYREKHFPPMFSRGYKHH